MWTCHSHEVTKIGGIAHFFNNAGVFVKAFSPCHDPHRSEEESIVDENCDMEAPQLMPLLKRSCAAIQCDEDERLPKRLCAGRPSNGQTPCVRQGSTTPSFTGSAVHDGTALLV